MSLDEAAAEHFRRGRAALTRKREELDDAIEQVDRILALITEVTGAQTTARPEQSSSERGGSAPAPRAGGARAAILGLVADKSVWRVSAIVDSLKQQGNTSPENSVRSLLTKMVKDGVLINPSRGAYQLADAEAVTDAESAAATALSVLPTRPLEGGEADGTGDHRDLDPHQGHRDHSGGAPAVVGG